MPDQTAPLDPYKTRRLVDACRAAFAQGFAARPDLALSVERTDDGARVGFFVRPVPGKGPFTSGREREELVVDHAPVPQAAGEPPPGRPVGRPRKAKAPS